MTGLGFKIAVSEVAASEFTLLPIYMDGNVAVGDEEGSAPPTGYVAAEWEGGDHAPAATGLEEGVLAVNFLCYGPREDENGLTIQGDGPATAAADRLIEIFRERELLAPIGDSGYVSYLRHSAPRDFGRDDRGFWRTDTTILFLNHTETPYGG